MRAAIVSAFQTPPTLGERPAPKVGDRTALLELRAAALNPADFAIASGSFPAGNPPLPYVPGIEGVGVVLESARVPAGARVWASGRGLGVAYDGTFSDRFAAADDVLVEVPADADDVLAAALGQVGLAAWMPLSWISPVQPGESVLVLGATGSVGLVAVQAAKVLGAARVVGAGRDRARLEEVSALGADDVVAIDGDDFRERLGAAVEGAPPTLVLDTLWGPPLEAAAAVAAPRARIVHIGQSAAPTATLASAHVRGKQLQLIGYSNFALPSEAIAEGYRTLVGHGVAGRIRLRTEAVPLERVEEAWTRQRDRRDAKLVVVA